MKKYIIGLCLLLPAFTGFSQQKKENFSKAELIAYFDQTFNNLKQEVKNLNQQQLMFSPDENRWSVSQCIYHLVLTEPELLDYVKKSMEGPANPQLKDSVQAGDHELIGYITDRSEKAVAGNDLKNVKTYTSANEALKALEASRKTIKDFINKHTEEELRNHFIKWPMAYTDAFQGLLFIAAHTARHTQQIKEVMNDPSFPK